MSIYIPAVNSEKSEKKEKEIRQFLRKNRISFLTHFTHSDNLKSILQFGLLPSSILRNNRTFDKVRFNGAPLPELWSGFIPCNISFPDYKLFTQLQNHQPSDWIVLLIDSGILADFPCYFFPERARDFVSRAAVPGQYLTGQQSFSDLKHLFSDQDQVKRKKLGIPSYYTTNPTSEILVSLPIAPSYIRQVFFYSEYKFNQWLLTNTVFALSQDKNRWACGLQYFSPRSDYTFWKTDINSVSRSGPEQH